MQVLNSPIANPESNVPYRAVVEPSKYFEGELTLKVQQNIQGEWHMTPGQWLVSTILDGGPFNTIAIDLGQGWTVDGVYSAALEANKLKG